MILPNMKSNKLNSSLLLFIFVVLLQQAVLALPQEEPPRPGTENLIRSRKLLPEGRDPVWLVSDSDGLSPRGSVKAEAPEKSSSVMHDVSCDSRGFGGGVIIAGLITTFFAVVFAYIRVTRRKDNAPVHMDTAAK